MLIRYSYTAKGISRYYKQPLDKINKITIFGSSVTSACNPQSDIDIYIDFGENTPEHFRVENLEAAVDLQNNTLVDNRLLENILETGVIIYAKWDLIEYCSE